MLRSLLIVAAVLSLAACDSGLDSPPLFSALEGTWAAQSTAAPATIRFLPEGRYEFVSGGGVTERGRYSLSSDGDSDDFSALRSIQFNAEPRDLGSTYYTVSSASAPTLALQRCATECEGVPTQVYERQ